MSLGGGGGGGARQLIALVHTIAELESSSVRLPLLIACTVQMFDLQGCCHASSPRKSHAGRAVYEEMDHEHKVAIV